ncbi:MAG: cytochrome c [Nitrospirae bacterium]|nr:cytochrome c [Nitrospirota bacterium]
MTRRMIGKAAILLWVLTVAVLGWVFVKGWTTPGADGRTQIVLAPVERDQILAEMRQLLKAVHGIVTAAGDPQQNLKSAEQTARAAGMAMAADVNPTIMAKLPLAFKQMGTSVHQDMDRLADAIEQGETPPQVLARLSSITGRCMTCHDMYRLSEGVE